MSRKRGISRYAGASLKKGAIPAFPSFKAISMNSTNLTSLNVKTWDASARTFAAADTAAAETSMIDVIMLDDGTFEFVFVEEPVAFNTDALNPSSSENDGAGSREFDCAGVKAAFEEWPGVFHLEQIDDVEELARNLWESCLAPHDHPRIEALFRKAASGKGYYSQRILASGLV